MRVPPRLFLLEPGQVVGRSRVFQSKVVEGNLMSLSLKNKCMSKRPMEIPRDATSKRDQNIRQFTWESPVFY